MHMVEFTVAGRHERTQQIVLIKVQAPALPRVGDYFAHDKGRISGNVSQVMFVWDHAGNFTGIEVHIQ